MRFESETVRIAVLDDYQRVAESYADWSVLAPHEVVFFHEHLGSEDAVAASLADFDVVCAMRERTRFAASLFPQLPRLALLVSAGMWNAAIDCEAAAANGVVVCGTRAPTSAAGFSSTTELTWGLIIAASRHLVEEDRALRAGTWQTSIGVCLAGKTLAVLGLGQVGTQVARVGRAFGMRLIAWSHNLTAEVAQTEGARLVSKADLFRHADILSIHLKLSDRTRGLVGRDELRQMKESAVLVNTSRGPIVDEAELVSALEDGAIAGAGLDVYAFEPLPADHPLRGAPNTVLSPHIGYVTKEAYEQFYPEMVDIISMYLGGDPTNVMAQPGP